MSVHVTLTVPCETCFMLDDLRSDGDGSKASLIAAFAVGVAMVTSLILAASYFVELPLMLGLLAALLWISALITACVLAARQGGSFWQSLGRAAKMFFRWIFNFG